MNWAEFLDMGGHGFYVWTSWGITLLFLLGQIIWNHTQKRAAIKSILRQYQREQIEHSDRNTENS